MWIEIVLFLVSVFLLLYYYVTKNFGHWRNRDIPYSKGYFPFGSYNFFGGKHVGELNEADHKKFASEKYFGWFLFGKPILGINDVNLLKHIEVKDFDHFTDRISNELSNSLFSGGDLDKIWEQQLTSISGDEWKAVRSAFTPAFTSGKMKSMLKFIKHIGGNLTNELETKAKKGEEFELKDVFGKFSLDALASSAFGVDAESFTNKDSKFVYHAAESFKQRKSDFAVFAVKLIPGVSQLFKWLKLNTFKPKQAKFFRDIILQTIRTRRETKERKNDMVDLMIDCIKDDTGVDETDEELDQYDADMKLTNTSKTKHQINELNVVATAMVLLIAGYDTTGMTLSYLAYELAKNPEVQSKLQEEIDQAFEESGGEFPDYNAVQSLPYLEMVIYETLRNHSPVALNTRVASKDYNLPGTDIVIKADDMVSWNARSLNFDPEHWTNPTEFRPEHFSKEEKANRSPYAFQTFGQGPRACIGMRFALLEAKVAVLSVLRKFSFKPGTKTTEPLVYDPEMELMWSKDGLWVHIEAREDL